MGTPKSEMQNARPTPCPLHITENMTDADLKAAGLKYNGYQEGFAEFAGGHIYTRLQEPRNSFMVGQDETLAEAHERSMAPYLHIVKTNIETGRTTCEA